MSDWITVIALVVAGVVLLITEILFVPGTTVVGILGIAAAIFGVYLSFKYFGQTVGSGFAVSSVALFGVAVYLSFKSKTWQRFSLKETSKGRVNEGLTQSLKAGDQGVAISVLKPIGKAEFAGKEYEVSALGHYLEPNTPLRIVKIKMNRIIVEPITN